MPKETKDRIGEIITTPKGIVWKVIAEAERGWSYDRSNGVETRVQRTRRFEIECQGCKNKREATYKNVFTSQNVVCFICQNMKPIEKDANRPGSKLQKFDEDDADRKLTKDGKVDGRTNRANTIEYVGRIFKCSYDTFLCVKELDRVISKNGKNLYRNFLVECQACGTTKEALSASLLSNGVACPKCRSEKRNVKVQANIPLPDLERKVEIMHEINQIWADMKRMQKGGTLNQYLMDKFDTKIVLEDEETTERFEMVGDNLDIDYDDPDIDWDNEINNLF
jgi:hypothetical protein